MSAFDAERFVRDLNAKRFERRMTWKAVAAESGVSASTLTRMVQGKRPDLDGFAALCIWGRLNANAYLVGNPK
jgi:transcriptional regulator with XRE-family HTH domain